MKKKTLLIALIAVVLALIVAAVGVTFAWYTSRVGIDNDLVLNADGFLVLTFEEDVKASDTLLKPAKAVKGAITDNVVDFDVLDENDPNLTAPATVVTYESLLTYINGENAQSQKGKITLRCTVYAEMADGTQYQLSLVRDIAVTVTAAVKYPDGLTATYDTLSWGNAITLDANCEITLTLNTWLLQPDDLCTPYVLEAEKVVITVTVSAASIDD